MGSGTFVLIGGGQMYIPCRPPSTFAIDEVIKGLGARRHPEDRQAQFLFIPTAAGDDMAYCHGVHVEFELRLGLKYDYLRLSDPALSDDEIRKKIADADIIYVGGGNTARMMQLWSERGLFPLLAAARSRGVVLSGLSAGALCWSLGGVSDSNKSAEDPNWVPMIVSGLGMLPFHVCPHWDSEKSWREPALMQQLAQHPEQIHLCIDDNAALVVADDTWWCINSHSHQGKVYRASSRDGHVIFEALPSLQEPRSLETLLSR